jgi:predicted transcriptional regulator
MTKTVQVHVGDSLETIGQRVINAWHRAERGELTEANAEIHVGFATWELMVRVLSPKRLELLRHLHRHPARSIRSLASALGRDYRRVHEDVAALEAAGLLDRDKDGVRAEYDAFNVNMLVAL